MTTRLRKIHRRKVTKAGQGQRQKILFKEISWVSQLANFWEWDFTSKHMNVDTKATQFNLAGQSWEKTSKGQKT